MVIALGWQAGCICGGAHKNFPLDPFPNPALPTLLPHSFTQQLGSHSKGRSPVIRSQPAVCPIFRQTPNDWNLGIREKRTCHLSPQQVKRTARSIGPICGPSKISRLQIPARLQSAAVGNLLPFEVASPSSICRSDRPDSCVRLRIRVFQCHLRFLWLPVRRRRGCGVRSSCLEESDAQEICFKR